VQAKLTALGFDPMVGSPSEVDKMFHDEVAKWGKLVKALNLSIK
jgi:tripartite-type tricarboxylate transporter receptor subunit TctC